MKKLHVLLLPCLISGSQAAINWTGNGATDDFYDNDNWDFTGSSVTAMPDQGVDATAPTQDDIVITGATINEPSAGFTNIEIGNNLNVTLDGTSFTFTNSNGFTGVDDDAALGSVGDPSTVNLINGSLLSAQFISVGLTVTVDSTSSLVIRGGGDGINSQSELTFVYLEPGGILSLPTRAEFDEQVTTSFGANTIFVGATAVTTQNMDTLFNFVGGTATAVPEPGVAALLGLAGLGLIRRRR